MKVVPPRKPSPGVHSNHQQPTHFVNHVPHVSISLTLINNPSFHDKYRKRKRNLSHNKTSMLSLSKSIVCTVLEQPQLLLTTQSDLSEASIPLRLGTTHILRLRWWIELAEEVQSTNITTVWAPRILTVANWTEWARQKSCPQYRSIRNCKCSTRDATSRL